MTISTAAAAKVPLNSGGCLPTSKVLPLSLCSPVSSVAASPVDGDLTALFPHRRRASPGLKGFDDDFCIGDLYDDSGGLPHTCLWWRRLLGGRRRKSDGVAGRGDAWGQRFAGAHGPRDAGIARGVRWDGDAGHQRGGWCQRVEVVRRPAGVGGRDGSAGRDGKEDDWRWATAAGPGRRRGHEDAPPPTSGVEGVADAAQFGPTNNTFNTCTIVISWG
uniref:Uncharacterized protein n=1 Tax=Leersia perrieri TaxID=77586 RepID=A0A0D9XYD7_9ORYZ